MAILQKVGKYFKPKCPAKTIIIKNTHTHREQRDTHTHKCVCVGGGGDFPYLTENMVRKNKKKIKVKDWLEEGIYKLGSKDWLQ